MRLINSDFMFGARCDQDTAASVVEHPVVKAHAADLVDHSPTKVVLPKPAGAEIRVSFCLLLACKRSTKRGREINSGRG
jgi:hypothetical protein